jgi:3-methyl-2-oxobutanoate hydroxymethyltransferase
MNDNAQKIRGPVRRLAKLAKRSALGRPIISLTAYDAQTAAWLAACEVDFILVGDSVANVIAGYNSTLPVTLDEMVYHTRMVVRGAQGAPVIGDMPFLSYEVSPEDAVRNAGRFVKEAGAAGVKVEGGGAMLPAISAIIRARIPVLGHVGLTPQSVLQMDGYHVQGKTAEDAERIRLDALALQEAGVFALVLECVPRALAARLTEELAIPTIGIGAGPDCDGQILVTHDLLGWSDKPKHFVKPYADFLGQARQAVSAYIDDVRKGTFPDDAHSF